MPRPGRARGQRWAANTSHPRDVGLTRRRVPKVSTKIPAVLFSSTPWSSSTPPVGGDDKRDLTPKAAITCKVHLSRPRHQAHTPGSAL